MTADLVNHLFKAYNVTPEIVFSDEMAHYDLLVKPSQRNPEGCYIEVKHRRLSLYQMYIYMRDGFMIEHMKYSYLKPRKGFYVCTFNIDGLEGLFMWDMSQIEVSFIDNFLGATTDFYTEPIEKKTAFLPVSNAQLFVRKDGVIQPGNIDELYQMSKANYTELSAKHSIYTTTNTLTSYAK